MFSRIRDALTHKAVWRLTLGPTFVFAAGTIQWSWGLDNGFNDGDTTGIPDLTVC